MGMEAGSVQDFGDEKDNEFLINIETKLRTWSIFR